MAQCLLWDYLGHLGMSTVSRDDSGVPADEDRRTIPTICWFRGSVRPASL